MVNQRVGILIQARYNSSRLPGKVLLPLPFNAGQTLLDQVILKAKAVSNIAEVIVATSVNPENKQLQPIAAAHEVIYFRGAEEDVLGRFYQAAFENKLSVIIRFTADNPFIDPELVTKALENHLTTGADYTFTNGLPLGTNIEIINFTALKIAHQEAVLPEEREHVTPFVRSRPDQFKLNYLNLSDPKYGSSKWRLTIDNQSDYALACILYQNLYQPGKLFTLTDVAALLQKYSFLININQENYQKKLFVNLQDELAEGIRLLHFYDLPNAAQVLAQHLS